MIKIFTHTVTCHIGPAKGLGIRQVTPCVFGNVNRNA